jgi:hypothetical protein
MGSTVNQDKKRQVVSWEYVLVKMLDYSILL